jgi:hypothetical protein
MAHIVGKPVRGMMRQGNQKRNVIWATTAGEAA